jgi:hypothetical protein
MFELRAIAWCYEHFLTDKGRDALAHLGVQPGDSTLADDHPPLTADCYPLPTV